MKNTVKLNESQLKKMIAESVKKILKEEYFGRRISQGGSRDTDFYDIDNGEDISEPGNKYAMKDAAEHAPEWDSKMYDLKRQTVGKGKDTLDYDSDWLEDDPMTKFDMAAQKHAMRDIRRNTSDLDWRNAGATIAVTKLGIPMSIAYKLSDETLRKILKDMGISYKSNYRKKISEAQLKNMIKESVRKVLRETELDYDMDNFSGNWSRGQRYDILVDGDVYYHDVSEEEVDRLYDELSSKPWNKNIEVVEL